MPRPVHALAKVLMDGMGANGDTPNCVPNCTSDTSAHDDNATHRNGTAYSNKRCSSSGCSYASACQRCASVISRNQRSIRFSQELLVGVKWM